MKKEFQIFIIVTTFTLIFSGCKDGKTVVENKTTTPSVTTSISSNDFRQPATEVKPGQTTAGNQAPLVTTIPDTNNTISATQPQATTKPQKVTDKPAKTTAPAATTTAPAGTTKAQTTTTASPKKVLNQAFKNELIACVKDYCNEVGLVYEANDYYTPQNSSWDIPIRTTFCDSNADIMQGVIKSRVKSVLMDYGKGTAVTIFIEDDAEAPGEWRIYVLF